MNLMNHSWRFCDMFYGGRGRKGWMQISEDEVRQGFLIVWKESIRSVGIGNSKRKGFS